MNNKKMLGLIFTFLFIGIFCLVNVKAYDVTTLKEGDRVCVASYAKNPIFADRYNENDKKDYVYIHTWLKETGKDDEPAYPWDNKPAMGYVETVEKGNPGEVDVFCYVVREKNNGNNWLLFASHLGKQTKDLHYLGDGLVYVIGGSGCSNGNCDGSWRVYDKSDLNGKLAIADSLVPSDYKIYSYQALLNVLDADRGPRYLATKDFAQDYEAFVINLDAQGNFVSYYEDVVNNLTTTLNNLVPRNIVVESAIGGVVSYTYEENSSTIMELKSSALDGYELKSLKILDYSDETKVIEDFSGQIDPKLSSQTFEYTYDDTDIIIRPVYKKKTYTISFTIDDKGKLYDSETGKEITAPIKVDWGTNSTLKVETEDGYDVKEVIVDGVSYKLTDGKVEIKNVQKDIEVVVNFKLKEYTITVDGTEYKVARGTSYEDLIKQINITKKGYLFKGIKDSNGKLLDENYVVDGDDKLEIIFEKDPLVEVPSTGDNIIGYIMIFISALIALSVFFITRKKNCKN